MKTSQFGNLILWRLLSNRVLVQGLTHGEAEWIVAVIEKEQAGFWVDHKSYLPESEAKFENETRAPWDFS